MEQRFKKNFLINLAFAVAVGVIIYISGRFLLSYLLPFVIASVIAFASQKPARKISAKLHLKTGTCAAVISALFYITVAGLFLFLIYRLAIVSKSFIENLADFFIFFERKVENSQNRLLSHFREDSPELTDFINTLAKDMTENLSSKLTNGLSVLATAVAKKTPSFLFSSIVALVASCYIAKDFIGLTAFIKELIGKKIYGNILKIKEILSTSVFKIIKGYLILMLITFAELTVGFLIIRIKYAPLLGIGIALIDLMPVFGTGTVLIPWVIAELMIGNTRRGIMIFVLYLIVTIVRNFLEPKIIGRQIGINPLFTLIAMFAGIKLFGALGLVIFPITLIVVIKYYKNELEQERNALNAPVTK